MSKIFGIPGIIRVDHIGLAVFDLEESINWYESFLGCKLVSREVNFEQKVEEAMLDFAGSKLQLLTPLGGDSPILKFLEKRGEGIQQIAIAVSSLDKATRYAKAHGIRLIFEEPKKGTYGSKINFLHPKDCYGVLIELCEF